MPDKILFIRRDNIGDLICTTPAIRAVREKYPDARIAVLVNSYNADVVLNNPDIDKVYVYQKSKHLPGVNPLSVALRNFRMFLQLRRERFDSAIACGGYSPNLVRTATLTGAKRTVGYLSADGRGAAYTEQVTPAPAGEHEVRRIFRLIRHLGIDSEPGPMVLVPDRAEAGRFDDFCRNSGRREGRPLVALSISARQRKRWPPEKFISLLPRLDSLGVDILLLWAPGAADNPTFPGDDEVAARIVASCGIKLLAYPAKTIRELTAALANADAVITLDGGSLHMAAALGKPVVALMPEQNVSSWSPWHVESVVLTAPDGVAEIEVEKVVAAAQQILAGLVA